jgi:hypothetical protein
MHAEQPVGAFDDTSMTIISAPRGGSINCLKRVAIRRVDAQRYLDRVSIRRPGLTYFVIDRLICIYPIHLRASHNPDTAEQRPHQGSPIRRHLLACVILAVMTSSASAQISDDVVRIGVLTDLWSWGRDNSGPGSVEAARMAVEEFGPTVLGKGIEIVSADHQMKVDVGTRFVRDWFDNGKVDAVADIPNSGVAIAVHNMVRERRAGAARPRRHCKPVWLMCRSAWDSGR